MLPTLVSIIQQRQPDKLPTSLQPVSNKLSLSLLSDDKFSLSESEMLVLPLYSLVTGKSGDGRNFSTWS